MRDDYLIALVLGALIIAGALMWVTRPMAVPVHPDDIFAPKVVQAKPVRPAIKPAPPELQKSAPKAKRKPAAKPQLKIEQQAKPESASESERKLKRLDLALKRQALEIPLGNGELLALAPPAPPARFDLSDVPIAPRPEVPKIKLFSEVAGTRGFSARRWLSNRMGVEAGIGLTEGETLRESQAAAGVGFVLGFD